MVAGQGMISKTVLSIRFARPTFSSAAISRSMLRKNDRTEASEPSLSKIGWVT